MFKINVGPKSDTLVLPEAVAEGEDLQTAIEAAMPMQEMQREAQTINLRLKRYPGRFQKRVQGKFTYYEYVAMTVIDGVRRFVKKRLSMKTEDKQLYVAIDAPWVYYDKETETSFAQFDVLTDELRESGWTEDATKTFQPAKDNNNTWTPA